MILATLRALNERDWFGSWHWWRERQREAETGQLRACGLFDYANQQANEAHARMAGYLDEVTGSETEFWRRLAMFGGANGMSKR
jgi:hypothetical protein